MAKIGYNNETIKVLSVASEISLIIALPIIILGLLGKHLDTKYNTGYFVYLGILLAIGVTSLWLYRRFNEMLEKLKEAAKIKSKDQTEDQKKEQQQK